MDKKANIGGTMTGLIVGGIALVVVEAVLNNVTFTSSIMNTVKPYIVPVAGVGLIVLASKFGGRK